MKPFVVPDSCVDLRSMRLSARTLLTAARDGKEARIILAQLWITEGIPFAFRKCPAVYELIRIWLGLELGVHAKQIGLTGSARLGESINPKKFGKKFDNESDLDLYIVSRCLFSEYKKEFCIWRDHYASGEINPKNSEKSYWEDNKNKVPNNINKGFIDVRKIPARCRYETVQKTYNLMYRLTEKLSNTPHSPSPRSASIRCYKNWASLIDQVSINLKWITDQIPEVD